MIGPSVAQAPAYQAPPAYQTPLYQGPATIPNPAPASNFPIASDARLAGDAKQTRFILDLDKPVQFRAFTLADPYRVIVDLPRSISSFRPEQASQGGDWSRPTATVSSCRAGRGSCST